MRFTVRRPASAEVSPCCHRPSGGNVACGVHISIARAHTTGAALENRLALAVFPRDMPTGRASLGCVRRWNEFEPVQGLVLQPANQQTPALAPDFTVEATFLRDVGARTLTCTARRAGHGRYMQILDADGVESARQIGGGLFHPVTPAICFTSAQPRNRQLGPCAPVRSASGSGQTPLQSAQSPRFTRTKAGNAQQLAGRQRCRYRHTAINTDDAPVVRSWDGFRNGGKGDMPTSRPIQSDAVGLHRLRYVAGPAEAHPADLGNPNLPIAAAEPLDMARFQSDLPESFVLAGLPPCRATVGAVEKVAHRLSKVPQRLLLHRLRPGRQPIVFGTSHSQLSTLLVITGRSAARLPVLLLLYRQIPHKPSVLTVFAQYCGLLRAGKQPKPAHIKNIGATTDNLSKGGSRRFLPQLKPRVSTPQIL